MYKLILALLLISNGASAEWYSSIGHMEDLVSEELNLISSLKDFIVAEEAKLERLKRVANDLKVQAEEAGNNMEKFLGHPVNQYHLMRRLKQEWDEMESMILGNSTQNFVDELSIKRSRLPNEEDIEGTAKAIMRLQDTYQLDTHELAEGKIKNATATKSLTADDCFKIGRTAYLEGDYYHCALWMREADTRTLNGDASHDRFEILDHLAYSLSQQNMYDEAYRLTTEMLAINPAHARIRGNHEYYKELLQARKKGDDGNVPQDSFGKQTLKRQTDEYLPERSLYERLCREGGDPIPEGVKKLLKCHFWDNNHPMLKIQPLKMEEMWPSPHLVRYYDILSEPEIESIKSMAKPRLNRATVQNPLTGVLEHAHYRVSKSAWLKDGESQTVQRVSNRIDAATGLTMETAEELQIANYGVGGQYEPHYDFARQQEKGSFEAKVGNRIATMLFYLTDIEYGGSTVFLHPKIAAKPIKGSAVFWYNLHPSGDGDLRTRHAACPVLTGVKWVGNKWIHERGQEFRRRCGLRRNIDNRIF